MPKNGLKNSIINLKFCVKKARGLSREREAGSPFQLLTSGSHRIDMDSNIKSLQVSTGSFING